MSNYYSIHHAEYISDTVNLDMTGLYGYFESFLSGGAARILDLGCGSGRDSAYFQSKGFEVTAADPTPEFCENAKKLGIRDVRRVRAEELNYEDEFDGIWACASLLHVPPKDLRDVFVRCRSALKTEGVMYCSFKYGSFAGERNGRLFHDLTEKTLIPFVDGTGLCVADTYVSQDVRPGRQGERWLNVILKKRTAV